MVFQQHITAEHIERMESIVSLHTMVKCIHVRLCVTSLASTNYTVNALLCLRYFMTFVVIVIFVDPNLHIIYVMLKDRQVCFSQTEALQSVASYCNRLCNRNMICGPIHSNTSSDISRSRHGLLTW